MAKSLKSFLCMYCNKLTYRKNVTPTAGICYTCLELQNKSLTMKVNQQELNIHNRIKQQSELRRLLSAANQILSIVNEMVQ